MFFPAQSSVGAPSVEIDHTRSLLGIRASAGSGKTYQLTARYLSLLRAGAGPSEILATTFTRKAAGEILERVLSRLAHPTEGSEALLRSFCRQLPEIRICTLESHFFATVGLLRFELGLPPQPELVDERTTRGESVRREAARRALKAMGLDAFLQLYDRHPTSGRVLPQVVEVLDQLLIGGLEVARETERQAWHALNPTEPSALALALAREALASADGTKLANTVQMDLRRFDQQDWPKFLSTGIPKKLTHHDCTFAGKPIPGEICDAYEPLIRAAQFRCIAPVARALHSQRELLEVLERRVAEVMREEGMLFFSDVVRTLVQRGVQPDELERRMGSGITHVLLDEFQDTSAAQWKALLPVVQHAISIGGSLFVVGDGKQSIYSWRSATPELLARLDESIPGIHWDDLDVNRRSSQEVLDAVNRVFTGTSGLVTKDGFNGWEPVFAAWDAQYRRHAASLPGSGYVRLVELDFSSTPDSEEGDDLEPGGGGDVSRAVLEEIVAIVEECAPCSVGVLVRKNSTVEAILAGLRAAGVDAVGEGGGALDDQPAVQPILAAIRLADFPDDTAAAYRLFHSPLAGPLGLSIWSSAIQRSGVSRRIRGELAADGYARVVTRWVALLAPAATPAGLERLLHVRALASSAREPERPSELAVLIQDTSRPRRGGSRVSVMTIHKSKGLEFDCVILPELQGQLPNVAKGYVTGRADPLSEIRAVYLWGKAEIRQCDPDWQAACEAALNRERTEALCLLYVAMTRARRALHLLIPPKSGKRQTAALLLREQLLSEADTGCSFGNPNWFQQVSPQSAVPGATIPTTPRLLALTRPTSHARNRPVIFPSELVQPNSLADLLEITSSEGRDRGTAIHALFARVRFLEDGIPNDSALAQELLRVFPERSLEWRSERLQQWKAMLDEEPVRRALSRPSAGESVKLLVEHRFKVRRESHLVSGAFDRVVILYPDGPAPQIELIDWKTDSVTDDTLPSAVSRYRNQVMEYRHALAGMYAVKPAAIHVRLVFCGSGKDAILSGG